MAFAREPSSHLPGAPRFTGETELPVFRTSARLSALIAGQDDSYRSGQKSNSANAEISSGLRITGFCAFAARWKSIGVWGVKLLSLALRQLT